jgi:hypothetical protein
LCEVHQNFELLLTSLLIDLTIDTFLKKVLCDPDQEVCSINVCCNCPKLEAFATIVHPNLRIDEPWIRRALDDEEDAANPNEDQAREEEEGLDDEIEF